MRRSRLQRFTGFYKLVTVHGDSDLEVIVGHFTALLTPQHFPKAANTNWRRGVRQGDEIFDPPANLHCVVAKETNTAGADVASLDRKIDAILSQL